MGADRGVDAFWTRDPVSAPAPEAEALPVARPQALTAAPARPTNYARSLFHLTSAATGVAAVTLLPSRAVLLTIAIAFAGYAWSMEALRRASPRFNERLMRLYARVAHPHEWHRVNSATWYATALVVLAAFASRPGMLAGLAVLGVADPLAGIVGRRYGRHKLRNGKSVEGAVAFFASGTLAAVLGLALVDAGAPARLFALGAMGAMVGAIVELGLTVLDDNFTIPVAVGAAVTLGTLGG